MLGGNLGSLLYGDVSVMISMNNKGYNLAGFCGQFFPIFETKFVRFVVAKLYCSTKL